MAATGSLTLRKHLTVADGFVLYITAVLGQSLIVLPSLAARQSGPWSILVWGALAALSYPMARVMAELGARFPSAGGVIAFIGYSMGKRVGELTGVLYLMAIALGAPATALFFAEYLGKLVPLTGALEIGIAALVLAVLILINSFDVTATMRWQRWAFFGCVAAVTIGIAFSLAHVSAARLTDVHGYTLTDVASTMLVCFFAFVGWENAAFAGEEFTDPTTLVKALRAAVIVVGALFLLLAIAVVGSLSRGIIGQSDASLSDLLQFSLGSSAAAVAAVIAMLIIFLLMITWVRSASRLVFALARDGLFPRSLATIDPASGSPRRALWLLGGTWAVALALYVVTGAHIEDYIRLSSANFAMTYVLIFIAAWRLLPGRRFLVPLIISSLAIAVLVLSGYQSLWYAAATGVVYAAMQGLRSRFTANR